MQGKRERAAEVAWGLEQQIRARGKAAATVLMSSEVVGVCKGPPRALNSRRGQRSTRLPLSHREAAKARGAGAEVALLCPQGPRIPGDQESRLRKSGWALGQKGCSTQALLRRCGTQQSQVQFSWPLKAF